MPDTHQLTLDVLEQGEPLVVMDREARILFVNRGFEELCGLSRERLLGQSAWEVLPGAAGANDRYRRECERALREQRPVAYERYQAAWKRWLDVAIFPIDAGLAVYFRDLSGRTRSDVARQESERHFQYLVENVEDYGIFMLDAKGRVTSWNRGAERITGFAAADIVGRSHELLIPEDELADVSPARSLDRALDEGRVQTEAWCLRKGGDRFWADVTLTAIRDEQGELTGFVQLIRDLSGRKRRDESLQRLENWATTLDESLKALVAAGVDANESLQTTVALNRAVLENALDAVIGMNEQGRIVDWNAQAEVMFGWSRKEALGKILAELIIPEPLRGAHWRGLRQYMETGHGAILDKRIEVEGLHRTGKLFPLELTVTPLPMSKVHLFYAFLRDVTERKRIERERQALVERLERNLSLNETFFSVLAHDLRTPLSAILMNASLLRLQRGTLDLPRIGAQIDASGQRMARMIEQLLDVSRARIGGGIPIQPQAVDLERLCRESITEVVNAYPERILDFDVAGDGSGQWDPDRLAQVVSNLLDNAVHHSPAESHVLVRMDGRAKDSVCMQIWNQGAIPAEVLPVLFEPFEHFSQGQRGRRGLGLGLYIAREIVTGHGGTIEVRSTPADGTTFIVRLPRRASSTDAAMTAGL